MIQVMGEIERASIISFGLDRMLTWSNEIEE